MLFSDRGTTWIAERSVPAHACEDLYEIYCTYTFHTTHIYKTINTFWVLTVKIIAYILIAHLFNITAMQFIYTAYSFDITAFSISAVDAENYSACMQCNV